jgi:hypothetical protein
MRDACCAGTRINYSILHRDLRIKDMEIIKKALATIGGPVWRLIQTSKHHHIGAVIVLLVIGAIAWAVI